jgi:hypothetical protein
MGLSRNRTMPVFQRRVPEHHLAIQDIQVLSIAKHDDLRVGRYSMDAQLLGLVSLGELRGHWSAVRLGFARGPNFYTTNSPQANGANLVSWSRGAPSHPDLGRSRSSGQRADLVDYSRLRVGRSRVSRVASGASFTRGRDRTSSSGTTTRRCCWERFGCQCQVVVPDHPTLGCAVRCRSAAVSLGRSPPPVCSEATPPATRTLWHVQLRPAGQPGVLPRMRRADPDGRDKSRQIAVRAGDKHLR